MKIALIGYGKMGRLVEQAAISRGHDVAAICRREIEPSAVEQADLCIEFTHPNAVIANVGILAKLNKPVVIGTTGWYEQLGKLEDIVDKHDIGVLYAPNFSIGVHLFYTIVAQAAKLVSQFPQYDFAGLESHHRAKVDSPSGTAHQLMEIIQGHAARPLEMPFASVRCGSIPGEHTILMDSPADTIKLTHTARSRQGFADGAVLAAEWLIGKKGLYTLDDMIREPASSPA